MPPKRTAKKPSTSSRVTNKIKDEFADAIKDSYTPKELDEMQRWQLQEIAKVCLFSIRPFCITSRYGTSYGSLSGLAAFRPHAGA